MMMGETQIAYLMLFTAPGMFAVNMLVARWMANEAPPVALAFWRWFGAVSYTHLTLPTILSV